MKQTVYIWAYYLAVIRVFEICTANNTIIQIGDSFAEYSKQSLATFCSGKTVENLGVSGTTTNDWDEDTIRGALEGKQFDQIMLAIGGNDYLGSGCTLSKDILRQRVASTIDRFISVANPIKDIVLLGYCQPTNVFDICGKVVLAEDLNGALASAVIGKKAIYVDTTGACGGGNERYMADPIHPNNRGYCTLYQNEMTQKALGCQCQEKVNCSEVSPDVATSLSNLYSIQSTPCGTNTPTPTESPVSQCADNTQKKFKIGKKTQKCSDLKKKHCNKWDKKKGNLVSNYCLELCDNCDKGKRCKDDEKVRFIEKGTRKKYKCKDLDVKNCSYKDKKKRLVSQYCRALCGFCSR